MSSCFDCHNERKIINFKCINAYSEGRNISNIDIKNMWEGWGRGNGVKVLNTGKRKR